jgi:hypothetical protein
MLSVATAESHITTTKRRTQMATRTQKPAARRIVPLAAAGALVLATALALAPPGHASAIWMAGAVNSGAMSKKTETFYYTNAYTQFDAEQHAMANCDAKFPNGCEIAGSTTSCMAVALGPGTAYAVAYGPSVQAAQVLAVMEIKGRVNPSGGHCSWD